MTAVLACDMVTLTVSVSLQEVRHLSLTADCVIDELPDPSVDLSLGDRILRVNGERVLDKCDLDRYIETHGNRNTAVLEIARASRAVPDAVLATSDSAGFLTLVEFKSSADMQRTVASASSRTLPQYLDTSDAPSEDSAVPDDGARFRQKIGGELDKVAGSPDRCIIGLCEKQTAYSINPLEQLQILAKQRGVREPIVVDGRVKLRTRGMDEFAATFKQAMRDGHWFFMVKAAKSITLLSLLGSLVEEMRERQLEGVHPDARIIISTEPHPHFPAALLKNAITLRVKPSDTDALSMTSISLSSSAKKMAMGQMESLHRVRLSTCVVVVPIDARDVTNDPSSPPIPFQMGSPTLSLQYVFQGLAGEKFYNVTNAGERNRFAVASAFGNVYILDDEGSSMVAFHAHDAALWDASFAAHYDVVTVGEDGLAVWWSRDPNQHDALICSDVVKQQNDVYAVRHTSTGRAVGLGGYLPHVLIRSGTASPNSASTEVLMPTAVQAIANLEGSEWLLCAGSDGSVCTIDAATGTILSNQQLHRKKCPCIGTSGPNTVVTGSYEGTVKLWDARSTASDSHCRVIKFQPDATVTGVAVSGPYIAACVGESLHVWDARQLSTALGSVVQAWRGASRGVVIDETTMSVVTASTDGIARFWSFASATFDFTC